MYHILLPCPNNLNSRVACILQQNSWKYFKKTPITIKGRFGVLLCSSVTYEWNIGMLCLYLAISVFVVFIWLMFLKWLSFFHMHTQMQWLWKVALLCYHMGYRVMGNILYQSKAWVIFQLKKLCYFSAVCQHGCQKN